MSNQKHNAGWFNVTMTEILTLFIPLRDQERGTKKLLYVIGFLFTPITLLGALWGYVRAYYRHELPEGQAPSFGKMKPITKVSMMIWALLIWAFLIAAIDLVAKYGGTFFRRQSTSLAIFLAVNLVLSYIIFLMFNKWKKSVLAHITESKRFGNARFATSKDLKSFERKKGLYIGGQIYGYPKTGHFLTIAGTRSGKLVNLIAPNLLGLGGLEGSKVIIDVKGEIAFVTARYQKQIGQNVLVLDPWGMVTKDGATFNPMDLINNQQNPEHLADDASIIAEMIVPKSTTGDQFFNNRARSMITGLLMHIVLTQPQSKRNLGTLWQMLRLSEDDWINLLADMSVSADVVVRAIANEIVSVYNRSEKTFASILSNAQDFTDFLKSPSLQKSLKSSNFDINSLSNGSTTLYVVIPPTHLSSHAQWLRLVVTTSMRAVVRNRNKRVLYILDEFATLGYLPEIETALSTYAGYNISVWAIMQDLGQLKKNYGDSWETFISNTAVRQFFGISDAFSADYLSKMFGETTYVTYDTGSKNPKPQASARRLMTPDEVRRGSADNILTIIEQKPVAVFEKMSYLEMPYLNGHHDPNPYYATEKSIVGELPKVVAQQPMAEKQNGYAAPSLTNDWGFKHFDS